ncbi:L-lactate dehydrogenase complex protein LldG [Actinopolyspora biskrensis]|uniref:L-lactate dehydrogenase complex protein LldG n=1 Tax=Actinopolyspora biskrensis TaxID=1470178 RepID=A0A852Z2B1_9ACTN|nr:L-lactate dehydrogenase complex protein LldG [Actinopolyspora biskrensis]
MNARDVVLGRVRDALAAAPPEPVTVPRDYRGRRELPDEQRMELLVDRLGEYRADVYRCSVAETAATVAEALGDVRLVAVPGGLDGSWTEELTGRVEVDSAELPVRWLEDVDGVVTSSAVTCAETGTVFLDASADQGRRALTLVPDLHVCVVDLSSVVVGVPEAVGRLDPVRPTTMISGPSATSDIELDRVEGVHGPRTLRVVVRVDG